MSPEFGYIDPGTGSLILQAIVGGVAAALVFAKFWWRRLLELLHIRKPEAEEPTTRAERETQAPAEASVPESRERAVDQASEPAARR